MSVREMAEAAAQTVAADDADDDDMAVRAIVVRYGYELDMMSELPVC